MLTNNTMHDIVKSYSFPLAQQLRQAHNALTHVETVLARPAGLPPPGPNGPEALTQGCQLDTFFVLEALKL